jgi:hypothetical protein
VLLVVKILMPEKSQVNLSPGRSLKHKNTQNKVFLFCRVIIKIRGIDTKYPIKHDYNN